MTVHGTQIRFRPNGSSSTCDRSLLNIQPMNGRKLSAVAEPTPL